MPKFQKYGFTWDEDYPLVEIELWCIRQGEDWIKSQGRTLYHHYREAQQYLWPGDDEHRWSKLILQTYCDNEITVLVGCSDSGKTWGMSKIILTDYWAFPEKTLWLVSTTEGRGAELRIWGCIKDLFNQARKQFDFLDGNPVDYLKTITTEEVDEERREARSLRAGIIVVPCKVGSVISGLSAFIGIKSPRLRHAGDEIPAMGAGFLNAYSNWYGKSDFKGLMSGNFMETDDPLGIASEPVSGWDAWVDTGKTQTWRSKFYNAAVVALDGRDSPNNDAPLPSGKPRYPYLINEKKLQGVADTRGTDSWEWYSQCVGKPAKGMDIWRVLNRDFCNRHGASEDVIWKDTVTHLYSLDPAYGGGDLCVGRHLEMGIDSRGKQTLFFHQPEIIPIKLNTESDAEDQIANYVYHRMNQLSVPAENCAYDSFGRGTLGSAFAKLFGAKCPVPIDSSAQCSDRPVRFDLFVTEIDQFGRESKRLKKWSEHGKKFVTELYFSCREAIDCDQVRGLDSESIREGCARKFSKNKDGKLELEPKEDFKERHHGKSPDRMDNAVYGVEIARQRGFRIENLAAKVEKQKGPDWLEKQTKEYAEFMKGRELALP